ncbi:MAG: SDR family oxidoreductase [Rhodospirillales bacterium]|nr:SDR family oxidoreductase [Rhodospirillales bacterium]
MARILVAGGSGYLGRFVLAELKRRGHFVRVLVRCPEKIADVDPHPDEVFVGDVTRPETLDSCCRGIETVFSSVGITRQRDGLTFRDVDYQGNLNLLEAAEAAGVERFVYVSVFGAMGMADLAIVKAHEDFVAALKQSNLKSVIMRPTAYFSDMAEILEMARRGRVFLFGSGRARVNPIHGADLARVCAHLIDGPSVELEVGGPQNLSFREIAKLAFDMLGRPARIITIPATPVRMLVPLVKLFDRQRGELLDYFLSAGVRGGLAANAFGNRTLQRDFQDRLAVGPEN